MELSRPSSAQPGPDKFNENLQWAAITSRYRSVCPHVDALRTPQFSRLVLLQFRQTLRSALTGLCMFIPLGARVAMQSTTKMIHIRQPVLDKAKVSTKPSARRAATCNLN